MKQLNFDSKFSTFSSKNEIYTELINLEAILNLPKGTEHYISDIHGEAEAFQHILRSGAGNIREKLKTCFMDTHSDEQLEEFALLIYYPEEAIARYTRSFSTKEKAVWYHNAINDLIVFTKYCATKYTRSKLRKTLPKNFVYIIEELIYQENDCNEKIPYRQIIIQKLIQLNQAEPLIVGICYSIQLLVVDHLHVVGDIFDRGPAADQVMDTLVDYPSLDIQWGNHDILWLGAYSGNETCLITLLRIAARYNYLYEIEAAYGLNLRALFSFASNTYFSNPQFTPPARKKNDPYWYEDVNILEKVHQALAIIQFKLEGQIIQRRPDFHMSDRLLLDKIDFQKNQIFLHDHWHPLSHTCFQTINVQHPYQLTDEESVIVATIRRSFQNSERLKKQMNFLLKKGSMYLIYNKQLLFHGCIPLTDEGHLLSCNIQGKGYRGKELLEQFEWHIRQSALDLEKLNDFSTDFVWYAWTGEKSPLFGKKKMTTFERYFIEDPQFYSEEKNPYYQLREHNFICAKILQDFGLDTASSHIINGHTPIKIKRGENPIKAEGLLFVIDGGLSKAYQKATGSSGYTLLYNSYGFQLVSHPTYDSVDKLFEHKKENISLKKVVEKEQERIPIRETTIGTELQAEVAALNELLKQF